jgi:xylulokinase
MPSDAKSRTATITPSDSTILIGVDVGTTSVRAIAFDARGRKIAASSRRTPVNSSGEYDPDVIFAVAQAVLADVAKALSGRPVAGIAVASIGESCVLLDNGGRAVAPSIIWHDRRTVAAARAIEEALGRERIFQITGHAVEPIFTLAKLIWMREHWSSAVAKARRVLMMADWIAFRLAGEAATDPMLASRTLYFDIRRWCWSEELLSLAGFDTDFPAPLAASGTPLGRVRKGILAETGLAGSPVVAVGGHDHVLGAVATGLSAPGMLIDSVGTAEGFYFATTAPLDDPETIRHGYVQGAIEIDRRMSYVGGSIFSSGGAIEWLRSVIGNTPQATLIAGAAAVPVGSGGVVFLPHLANSPPPAPDEHSRGAFLGLTAAVTPPMLYRAVLEGLAMQSRMLLDGLTALSGVGPAEAIRLIGGVSRNRLFLSIKANVFAQPIVVVEEPEATALGAALLGGVAAGIYPTMDAAIGGLDRKTSVVEPDATAERYEQLRTTVFAPIHGRVRPINRSLDAFLVAGRSTPG